MEPYREALRISPKAADARFGYGMALVRLGRYSAARDWFADAAPLHPDRPDFQHALARLLAAAPDAGVRNGRQAQALEVYRDGRQLLADQLGLEPAPKLRELERQILTQDPALDERVAARPLRGPLTSRRLAALAVAVSAAALLALLAVNERFGARLTWGRAA